MIKQQDISAILRRELESVITERRIAKSDRTTQAARSALRRFQVNRMMQTHADLLAAPESSAAANFFLSDLYGPEDLTQRDASLQRVVTAMERLLPEAALKTVADAIALDALSEKLDAAMARELGKTFTEEQYIAAYRKVTARADRERQLAYIEAVGFALCDLVRVPLIGSTLAMMRGPAKMANLGELQSFLERGFKSFKGMRRPRNFVATILRRERTIMTQIYAGTDTPFSIDVAALAAE